MVALGTTFTGAAFQPGGLPIDVYAGYSGPFFVLNDDTAADNTLANDIWSLIDGDDAAADNIRPVVIPNNGVILELRHVIENSGGVANDNATPVSVICYGQVPTKDVRTHQRLYPEDLSSNHNYVVEDNDGWWVPLLDYLAPGSPIIQIDDANILPMVPTAGDQIGLTGPVYLSLNGALKVICAVETPSVVAVGFDSGMIIGRIIGPRS